MTRRTPVDQAADVIRDGISAYADPAREKHIASLVIDYATAKLESRGMAPDTAADLVERVWRDQFSITVPN